MLPAKIYERFHIAIKKGKKSEKEIASIKPESYNFLFTQNSGQYLI